MASVLEKLYPYCPVWLQNLGISAYGYAYKRERLAGDFDDYVNGFRERDRWSTAQMKDYVAQELQRVLNRAFTDVSYYQECWTSAGFTEVSLRQITPETLWRLPVLPKREVRLAPERFVSESTQRRKKLLHYSSSGSTGTPIEAIYTKEAHRRFLAAREVRSFGWARTSIKMPRSVIGGRMVVPCAESKGPYYRYNWAERQVYFSAYHIAPTNAANYIEGFHRYRPQVLTGYAFSHFLLARMMSEQGLTLDYEPRGLILGSEKLTPKMKQVITNAFHARAYEEYGAVENCMLATECEQGNLHVSPDFGIIEIVDDDGYPVPPGVEGRILCTGLLNDAQLLIRYDIGDVGVWTTEPCPCGREHLPVLREVVGRLEDVVIGPDDREMVRFHGIFIGLPHVLEGQVIQESRDEFIVKVIAMDGFGAEDKRLIFRRFEERLGEVNVHIERVGELERNKRGKFRAVISRVKRDQ